MRRAGVVVFSVMPTWNNRWQVKSWTVAVSMVKVRRLLLVRATNRLFLERVDSVDHIFELLRSLRMSRIQIANELVEAVNIVFFQARGMAMPIFRVVVGENRL